MQPSVHSRHLSLNHFALVVSALGATVVVAVLSLMLISNQPIIPTNTAKLNLPIPSIGAGRDDDILSIEWLAKRKASTPAIATARENDVLSVEWLIQRNAANTSQPQPAKNANHPNDCNTTLLPAFCP